MSSQYGELGPLAAEIVSLVCSYEILVEMKVQMCKTRLWHTRHLPKPTWVGESDSGGFRYTSSRDYQTFTRHALLPIVLFFDVLNIQIDLLYRPILKKYDQQFTLTTKR